jgi:hypothetical protein
MKKTNKRFIKIEDLSKKKKNWWCGSRSGGESAGSGIILVEADGIFSFCFNVAVQIFVDFC